MQVQTTRFGTVEVDDNRILEFPSAKNVIITTSSENQMLVFDQNGALSDFSQDYEITIQSGTTTSLVQISPTTGSIF